VLALKLDLGKSHEAAGDVASARLVYEEIQAVDPDFADVVARLDELEKLEDIEAQEDGSQNAEEYETFDEFLGDLDGSDADEPEAVEETAGASEEAPAWETFDDVVAEMDAADDADSAPGEPGAEAVAEPEPDAEDPGLSEPAGEAETTPKRRKKRISFV
jgi:hypothetical protein